jgi:hypothetical protein
MKAQKNYTRNYVGKGRPATPSSIKFTITMDMINLHKWEKDGVEYFTFETSKMKEADMYGRTHTAWVTTVETSEKEEAPEAPKEEIKFPPEDPKIKKPRKKRTAA